ncbi:hypothetical protein [Bordetella sp. FB-8]|uniref:hypothetical protein n=1 Tax=Bordetella sp. FB-8 TaxID=1159870 RepID=UPI0012DF7ABA|nr:hypothetical protein [Bordetella sp. FB-8]
MSKRWRLEAEKRLMAIDSPFVLSTAMLLDLALAGDEQPVRSSVQRWITEMLEGSKLQAVTKGLYLNRLGHPRDNAAEAAHWIRRGAVLSLSWVLEQAGVMNNYGDTYTCIIPTESSWTTPSLAIRDVPGIGRFRFFALRTELMDEAVGKQEDVFDLRFNYRRATPEKALLDWIYLGHSHRSTLSLPPLDIEADRLSLPRLKRLARGMGMAAQWENWWSAWRAYQDDPSVIANAPAADAMAFLPVNGQGRR